MEIWKDVVGYEGFYKISNMGNLKSCERYSKNSRGQNRKLKEKIIKTHLIKGYPGTKLVVNKKRKHVYIHKLVAEAFLSDKGDKQCINHIDGNPLNNKVENLEWATFKENSIHAIENGLNSCVKPIILSKDGIDLEFNTSKKASNFLGYCDTYIGQLLRRGKNEVKGYKVILKGA